MNQFFPCNSFSSLLPTIAMLNTEILTECSQCFPLWYPGRYTKRNRNVLKLVGNVSLTGRQGKQTLQTEMWFATGKAGNRECQCSSWNDWVRGGGNRKGQTEPRGWRSLGEKELVIKEIIRVAWNQVQKRMLEECEIRKKEAQCNVEQGKESD